MALTRPRIQQFNTTISSITDPITVLKAGTAQANVDIGFLMNRSNGLVSNVALYWSEAGNTFVTAFTSNTGLTDSNITATSYANITTGAQVISPAVAVNSTSNVTGALTVAGGVGVTGNIYSGNLNIGGLSQAGLSITSTTSNRTAAIFFQDQYNLDIHPGSGYLILSRGNQNIGMGGNTSPVHRMSLTGDAYMSGNLTTAANVYSSNVYAMSTNARHGYTWANSVSSAYTVFNSATNSIDTVFG